MNNEVKNALQSCGENFKKVISHLDCDDIYSTEFLPLWTSWNTYFTTQFSHFDRLLHIAIHSEKASEDLLVALSISHHNLDRLMEVLHPELKDQRFSSAQIPERVNDLIHVLTRLQQLLDKINMTYTTT